MSGTKNFNNHKVIDAADMSSNITGDSTDVKHLDNIGIHLIFTGTPTGTFNIQGSNDKASTKTWTDLDFGSTISASGSGDSHLISINNYPFQFIRTKYSASSGSGSLDAFITSKEI